MIKATRSLIASEMGIARAKKALIDLGINQTVFGERLGFSRSTISSFFNRTKPVDHTYFTKICKTLNLNWEEIVEKNNPMKLDNCQIQNTTGVETNSHRAAFVIEGSYPIDDLTRAKLQAVVKQLQKITGDASLEIVDIQEGSIKIILKGTSEALSMIQDLYNSGQLNELISGANLIGSDLSGANLSGADLYEANFYKANLSDADLSDADLSGANLSDADLSGANLSGANLSEANLSEANLSEANLSEANLMRSDLRGANLSRSVSLLFGANLSGAYLSRANLSYANLSHADLSTANLGTASLIGADLSYASLNGANLNGANLNGANLNGANLYGANLSYANLSYASLNGANLSGANLSFTRFVNNLGISEDLRLDLINRGAIFDDSMGDRSRVIAPTPSPARK